MTVSELLYTVLISPLELMFDVIFVFIRNTLYRSDYSIVFLSLAVNLFLLPLYLSTDRIQEEAAAKEKAMAPMLAHIKKTFRGDERYMMVSTFYRQNHYKPWDSLKGLTPLMLEIPFFMAAYHFLSRPYLFNNELLFLFLEPCRPDGILKLGNISINLLPILMTIVNLLSGAIYTKEAPRRVKIQLYAMAGVFLLLLYDAPAALTFYWTLNNLFSLIKNIIQKYPRINFLLFLSGTTVSILIFILSFLFFKDIPSFLLNLFIIFILNIPAILLIKQKKHKIQNSQLVLPKCLYTRYFLGLLAMTVLLGLVIPSALVHASPEEFIAVSSLSPLVSYIFLPALQIAGFFLIWGQVFYSLADRTGKEKMADGIWILTMICLINFLFFGKDYGTMSSYLTFDSPIQNSAASCLINVLILTAAAALILFLMRKYSKKMLPLCSILVSAMVILSLIHVAGSYKILSRLNKEPDQDTLKTDIQIPLSREGHNVVIIMLDRAISGYVPYIFEELPQLKNQFAGFTFFPNTLSFGPCTNLGLPGIFGGYEYTPLETNKRQELTLVEKHNQSLKLLPVLFKNAGAQVTVSDPTYAGYHETPDLSIYSDQPGINTYNLKEIYKVETLLKPDSIRKRTVLYSFFKASPVLLHKYLYNNGLYLSADIPSLQIAEDHLHASGANPGLKNNLNVLHAFPQLFVSRDTDFTSFFMICNDSTHSPGMLQLPDYTLSDVVDNTPYSADPPVRTDGKGNKLILENLNQIQHYHCNAAAYLEIGKWLDCLRSQDLYDQTRIIIVSDHGKDVDLLPSFPLDLGKHNDLSYFSSLLLFKDFSATEFMEDRTLMTNAEVPYLATKDLIADPRNPFTGKPISSRAGTPGPYSIFCSHKWQVTENNGTAFLPDHWLTFEGQDIMDLNNWSYAGFGELPQS